MPTRNKGLLPTLQRKLLTTLGAAGDSAGNLMHANGAAIQATARAAGTYVDGGGRALGGRVGDWGNGVKDASGAPGRRMATPRNPLGLRGKTTV